METKILLRNLTAGQPKTSAAKAYRIKRGKNNSTDYLMMFRLYSACIKGAATPKDFKEGVSEFRRIMWNAR